MQESYEARPSQSPRPRVMVLPAMITLAAFAAGEAASEALEPVITLAAFEFSAPSSMISVAPFACSDSSG